MKRILKLGLATSFAITIIVILSIVIYQRIYTKSNPSPNKDITQENNMKAPETTTYTIKNYNEKPILNLEFDKNFPIYAFNTEEVDPFCTTIKVFSDDYILSVINKFTYCIKEQALTDYFIPPDSTNYDYVLSYPAPQNLNKDYIYYDTDQESNYTVGLYYDWEDTTKVHGYKASYIKGYYNMTDNDSPFYNSKSQNMNKYCVFSLYEINNDLTGYLVYHGARSIGGEEDFCKTLNKLKTFKIQPPH